MAELINALHQFHFLRPWWLLGAIAVVWCCWLLHRRGGALNRWRGVIAEELLPYLSDGGDNGNNRLSTWLLWGGLAAVIALAGPTWSKKPTPVHRQESPLIILFDLSPSMLATDLEPDRLTRARLKTIDLLKAYTEGTAALIAYAADAHVVTPLTDDANTIISQLPVLTPAIMPAAGSNPEAALAGALALAENAGHQEGDIILVTDGVTPGAREALESMIRANPAFRLSILGVGTDEGAPIPVDEHGFARDAGGGIVIARLHSAELKGLADRAGGVYRTLTAGDGDIEALLAPLAERSGEDARALARQLDLWKDQGIWLVIALLPLAALLFRRGLIATLLVFPLLHPSPAKADFWEDLWRTPDQQGLEAFQGEDFDAAGRLFENPAWQGAAHYRAGDYRAAARAFAGVDTSRGHYNRGNALAQAGDLEAAIEAYERALALQPGMADARHNKDLVERLLEEKQGQQNGDSENAGEGGSDTQQNQGSGQENGEQSGEPGGKQPGSGAEPGGNERSGEPGNDGSPDKGSESQSSAESGPAPDAGDGESTSPDATGQSQSRPQAGDSAGNGRETFAASPESEGDGGEQSAAAEQWLRRVPDDPGGLLRNKFEYESRRRFREERSAPRPPPDHYSEERW